MSTAPPRRRRMNQGEREESFDDKKDSLHQFLQLDNRPRKNSFQDSWSNSSDNFSRKDSFPDTSTMIEEPTRPISSHKSISDFMVDDRHYRSYHESIKSKKGKNNTSCACCCGGFSVVGVLFMIFVGVLIEKQSLYLKGIKSKQYYYYANKNRRGTSESNNKHQNSMEKYLNVIGDDYDANDPNVVRRRLSMMLGNVDLTMNNKKQKENNHIDEEEVVHRRLQEKRSFYFSSRRTGDDDASDYGVTGYYMHELAKTSFKTAAAYFLTLVLCIVYASNDNRIRTRQFILQTSIQLQQLFGSLTQKYRSKSYSNIPEAENISVRPEKNYSYHATSKYSSTHPKKRSSSSHSYRMWKKIFGKSGTKTKRR